MQTRKTQPKTKLGQTIKRAVNKVKLAFDPDRRCKSDFGRTDEGKKTNTTQGYAKEPEGGKATYKTTETKLQGRGGTGIRLVEQKQTGEVKRYKRHNGTLRKKVDTFEDNGVKYKATTRYDREGNEKSTRVRKTSDDYNNNNQSTHRQLVNEGEVNKVTKRYIRGSKKY